MILFYTCAAISSQAELLFKESVQEPRWEPLFHQRHCCAHVADADDFRWSFNHNGTDKFLGKLPGGCGIDLGGFGPCVYGAFHGLIP